MIISVKVQLQKQTPRLENLTRSVQQHIAYKHDQWLATTAATAATSHNAQEHSRSLQQSEW